MPLVPQRRSPSVAPAKNQRASSLSIEAVANRLAALEAKIANPAGTQIIPPFSLLFGSAQSGNPINITVQGGGSPTPPPDTVSVTFGSTAVSAGLWLVAAPTFSNAIVGIPSWNTTLYLTTGFFNFGTAAPPGGGTVLWIAI